MVAGGVEVCLSHVDHLTPAAQRNWLPGGRNICICLMGFAGSLPILPVFTGARFDFSPLESWSPLLFPYFNPETLASGTSKFMCASIFVPLPQYMWLSKCLGQGMQWPLPLFNLTSSNYIWPSSDTNPRVSFNCTGADCALSCRRQTLRLSPLQVPMPVELDRHLRTPTGSSPS